MTNLMNVIAEYESDEDSESLVGRKKSAPLAISSISAQRLDERENTEDLEQNINFTKGLRKYGST